MCLLLVLVTVTRETATAKTTAITMPTAADVVVIVEEITVSTIVIV